MRRKIQLSKKSSPADFQTTLQQQLAPGGVWGRLFLQLRRIWTHLLNRSTRRENGLRLVEMVGLGEKRFVAVIEYQHERFLLGGSPASVCLLSQLRNASNNGYSSESSQPGVSKQKNRQTKKITRRSSIETKSIVALLDPSSSPALPPKRKPAASASPSSSMERLA